MILKIAVIAGTVRKSRKSISVANYIKEVADKREEKDIEFEVIDLKEVNLPMFTDSLPPGAGQKSETQMGRDWLDLLSGFEAFVFVTAEYNGSFPGALKNALDYINREITNKAGAIVSYGSNGGRSASDDLRLVLSRQGLILVKSNPVFKTNLDFNEDNELNKLSKEKSEKRINVMIDSVIKFSKI